MTPQEMMDDAAALLNDQVQSVFTDAVLLPYYNMALQKIRKVFEKNNIPVTNATSTPTPMKVAAGVSRIAFTGTVPQLPGDLVDIRELWESPTGTNVWTPMTKKDFIPHYIETNQIINQFLIYTWQKQEIKLVAANADNDLKMDYVADVFPRITISQIVEPQLIINVEGFLTNWMAGLAAFFIGEDSDRAEALYGLAEEALLDSLGISVKGQQAVATRRRPFRSAYKQRQVY